MISSVSPESSLYNYDYGHDDQINDYIKRHSDWPDPRIVKVPLFEKPINAHDAFVLKQNSDSTGYSEARANHI